MQVWDVAVSSRVLELAPQIDLERGILAADPTIVAGHVVVFCDLDGHHRYALVEQVSRTASRVRYTFFLGEAFSDDEIASLALTRQEPVSAHQVDVEDIESLLGDLRPSRTLTPSGRP